jgi:hypothetical protein
MKVRDSLLLSEMPSIIFMGASGAGKTWAAKSIALQYGHKFVESTTRKIEEQFGGREKILKEGGELRSDFQLEVGRQTSKILYDLLYHRHLQDTPHPFVSDRGIDFLVYESLYGGNPRRTLRVAEFGNLVDCLQSHITNNVWVILLQTGRDSYRKMTMEKSPYVGISQSKRQYGGLKVLLGILGIPYLETNRNGLQALIHRLMTKERVTP